MPGFTTHYFFGETAYRQLFDPRMKKLISDSRQSYRLGLQGPDIFFYCLPAYFLNKKNIGNLMHTANVMDFFRALLFARNHCSSTSSRRIADAYICGFMAHYTLDTLCHPYVFFRVQHMKNKDRALYDFGRHVHLETDIDKEVLWRFKAVKPSQFRPEETIRLSREEARIISRLLEDAIESVYPSNSLSAFWIRRSILAIERENRWMHDPGGWKKRGVRSIEQMILGHSFISAMIPSDTMTFYRDPCNTAHRKWYNPWAQESVSTESVFDLMEKAIPVLHRRIELYDAIQRCDRTDENRYYEAVNRLLSELGDCSYDSGFPLEN